MHHPDFFSALFFGGGFIELRVLPSKARCFVPADAPDGEAIEKFLNAHRGENVYFGVAARREATDGTLENCASLAALFTDLDFKTLQEVKARERLATFPLPPSFVVSSGGGLHAYWLLREPLDLQAEAGRAKDLLRRLAHEVGGDLSAAEPARVLRVPGTLNRKYTPPRQVRVELLDRQRQYNPGEFDWVLPQEPTDDGQGAPFTVPEQIHEGGRNDTLYRLARSLKAKGLSPTAILAALEAENAARCEPPLPAGEVQEIAEHAADQADRSAFTPRGQHSSDNGSPWGAARPAPALLNSFDEVEEWLEKSVLAPGSITEVFSPRGVGKTHVAHAIGVRLARAGKRALLLDRDNSRREVRRRLRGWGAGEAPTLKVMTRDQVPPLTDTKAWRDFPFREYDLIVIDSLDATTEGIGEKDSAKPSKAIAPILDIARREDGPAVLVLGNTVKSAAHGRGSGVIEDRADICFEVRDATGLSPTGRKSWWLELPQDGAGAWAERAARRKKRTRYRLAFIPSKFRIGEEPDPFLLEIDLSTEPWTLRDVTAEVLKAGEEARAKVEQEAQEQSEVAVRLLTQEIQARAETRKPLLADKEAVPLLMEWGLKRAEARRLLADREGQAWRTETLTARRGHPKALLPISAGAPGGGHSKPSSAENTQSETPQCKTPRKGLFSADRMDTARRKASLSKPALAAEFRDPRLFPPSLSDTPPEALDEIIL